MRRVLSAAVVAAIASLLVVPVAAGWTWPADGPVLRPFSLAAGRVRGGPAPRHRHRRRGRRRPCGRPPAGTVSFVGSVPAGGRALTIQTADGYAVTLLQLGSVAVARGSSSRRVRSSAQVGESEDAVTTAPHVHLGIRVAAEPNGYVDPVAAAACSSGAQPSPEPAPCAGTHSRTCRRR